MPYENAQTSPSPARQARLLADILASACKGRPDMPVRAYVQGAHLLGLRSQGMGLCSRAARHGEPPAVELQTLPSSVKETAELLLGRSGEPDAAAFGMAAVNLLLPFPAEAATMKAQELIMAKGRGKRVAVVGHFPFVERMGQEFADFWVIEKELRPGDRPEHEAEALLPQADVVAMTGTTLLNGSCERLLRLCRPGAFTIMLGPSTPMSPCLFDWGLQALGGTRVSDPELAVEGIQEGRTFKQLRGVEQIIWLK
ncbi:Rossmann-like domain-containing protein [Desulfocurvibacter africanus]|uniref:Putative heavy-metal chelation domain-containing protein n=1 Tax=Desulfocurvibacter africanus subsp. africanus str. Walvis Bay TaxID=690850 RepID=F3Z0J8_DESAF|nr:DUF364 domain-containing protein [Desulfocurvibacter africanus]EGJ52085.1 protein of unknown function DUF364 [Desulfocurvibacter africanus subsp. africanus str. Walvis Bay]